MRKKIEMTEVAPVKPDVKPKPEREVKPRPRKDDPWTVPAPKVNPTPKAFYKKVMSKKMLITKRRDFEFLKKLTTVEDFYSKFEVSMNVVAEVVAEEAMVNLYFEDSRVATADEILELKRMKLL